MGIHSLLSPGDFPNPGIEPVSLALQADSLPSEPPGKPLTKRTTKKIATVPWPLLDSGAIPKKGARVWARGAADSALTIHHALFPPRTAS